MSGTIESGSVAMDASSRKTIGKSIPSSFREAEDKQVVQIYLMSANRPLDPESETGGWGVEI